MMQCDVCKKKEATVHLTDVVEEESFAADKLKCSSCKFTFQDFRKVGRLGCQKCYDTLKDQLRPLLRKIHGADSHTGKILPGKEAPKDVTTLMTELKVRLEKAIKFEEFEEAARLRDRIKILEKRTNAK